MVEVDEVSATGGAQPDRVVRVRSWNWVWALALTTAVLAFVVGPAVVVLLGAGMVAGGLWVRRDARAARDRAIAGGIAAAGAALLLVSALMLTFLLPVSSSGPVGDAPVPVVEVENR